MTIAIFARYMRSAALDSLGQDYVEAARARGAGQRRVLVMHVLRNSLVPVVTLVGLSFPQIIGGALVVESLFNIQGMGWQIWQAAQNHDFPVMLGFTLVIGVAAAVGSLAGRHRLRGAGPEGQARAVMTANRAVPDQAGWGAAAGPEAAAGPVAAGGAAALVPDLAAGPDVAAGPEFAGAPVRGSRGRHAGPASAGPPGGLAPGALLAAHTRRGLAACRDYPLATAGGLIIVAVVAFCFLGPLVYHSDLTHVFLSSGQPVAQSRPPARDRRGRR